MPPQCASASIVHPHRIPQQVVGVQVVVGVGAVTLDPLIHCQAEDGGTDGRPLCLGQGDGAEVVGEDVGAGHERLSELSVL